MGCGNYNRPGQKNEVLKIRVKRFSSPMRRGGGSSGGPTGQGQVPGALRGLWGWRHDKKRSLSNVRCGGTCCLLHIFVAMCYCVWLWWVEFWMLLSLRHWGQVLSQALSGTVGHCEHMSGTVGLSGCRAVGILDSLTLLDTGRAWSLSGLAKKWCRALSGLSG